MEHELSAQDRRKYVLGGKAIFTVESVKTGVRATFKAQVSKDGGIIFVGAMMGSDNERYAYLGTIKNGQYRRGVKARVPQGCLQDRIADWTLNHLEHPGIKVYHHGRCGRCGRLLTVPESIKQGLGPECAGR